MNNTHQQIWQNCLAFIKQQIDPQDYKRWFDPITSDKYDKNTLTISIPNRSFYEWLEKNALHLLRTAIKKELGSKANLAYKINDNAKKAPNNTPQQHQQTKKTKPKWLKNSMYLNPKFSFKNFVIGDSNQLAQASAHAISLNPGKTPFNPFLIHSKVGLGKTHLAQAIVQHAVNNKPNLNAIYTTGEKFTNQFIEKIRENNIQAFIDAYSNLDLLIVDDIQFISGKNKTQEIFFHLFNQFHQKGKQIVMTSDQPPSDLKGFEKRLLSRFKWGLTTEIREPNLETRIAIIHSKLQQHNFELSNEIIDYIATKSTTNTREIEGILISIIACADLTQKNITTKMVQQIIDNVVTTSKPEQELNMQYLQKAVANYFKIPIENLRKKSRKREDVLPRQLVMYLLRRHTNESLKAIGNMLGHKDHSTISYGCTNIRTHMQKSKHFKSQVEDIEKNIRRDFPQIT